jgi:hypothetical protein
LVKWRRSLRLRGKRQGAELLPPLFGTAKSGARYDRGTWQYWVVRLPLGIASSGVIFGHELRHNLALLLPACLAAGIDMALGQKRQPVSWTQQCAGRAVTVVAYAAAMFGFEQFLFGDRVLGACLFGASLAWGLCSRLANRLAARADRDAPASSAPAWELTG